MIRIDLGKEEVKASRDRASKGGKVLVPKNLTGGKEVAVDIVAALLFVAAGVVAFFPQPFVKQYIAGEEAKHQEDIKRLNGEVNAVTKKITELKPYQTELDSYQKQKQVVTDRINAVQKLLDSRGTPVNVLDIVGQNLPTRAWIEKLDFSVAGEKPMLRLSGKAYGNEEISDYLDSLTESIYLSNVKLEDVTSIKQNQDFEVMKFEITAVPKTR